MCGICGYLSASAPVSSGVLEAMTGTLGHRGPDGQGTAELRFSGEDTARVGLGHTRLSILDLSAKASQPMSSPDAQTVIVFNGEIYNYLELRKELENLGVAFRSSGDTEVALQAYRVWGTECFARFNGMWGLAIFDRARDRVVLSRDRFGEKPLYYCRTPHGMVFASEIKALLVHPAVQARPNYRKIYRNLAYYYGFVDYGEDTYFEGVSQLPKNTFMVIGRDLTASQTGYWNLDIAQPFRQVSDQDAAAEFLDLFSDSVKIRLRSDVEVGCMLSGGLDSTSTTAIAAKILGQPLCTFSAVTGELKSVYDESEYIDLVAAECSRRHNYVYPAPDDLFQTTWEMLGFHDEPVCTVTWYVLYLIARKIREFGIKVILTGHGGDELLGGYWDLYHYNFFDLFLQGDFQGLNREVEHWRANHGRDPAEIPRSLDKILNIYADPLRENDYFMSYPGTFTPEFSGRYANLSLPATRGTSLTLAKLYSDLDRSTRVVTKVEDRNTMACSIESRTAFLDHRLYEFCYALPNRFRIRDGLGKWLLRKAMTGILPDRVRLRKDKSGLNAPAGDWFRGRNRAELLDLLASASFRSRGIYDLKGVTAYIDEHMHGRKNHHQYIWQLMNTELWMRKFFD